MSVERHQRIYHSIKAVAEEWLRNSAAMLGAEEESHEAMVNVVHAIDDAHAAIQSARARATYTPTPSQAPAVSEVHMHNNTRCALAALDAAMMR